MSGQTKKEQRKAKINEIIGVASEIEEFVNQSSEITDKSKILPLIEKLKELCKAQAEVLRLSQIVILYDLTEKQKGFFKSLYLKEINKILN